MFLAAVFRWRPAHCCGRGGGGWNTAVSFVYPHTKVSYPKINWMEFLHRSCRYCYLAVTTAVVPSPHRIPHPVIIFSSAQKWVRFGAKILEERQRSRDDIQNPKSQTRSSYHVVAAVFMQQEVGLLVITRPLRPSVHFDKLTPVAAPQAQARMIASRQREACDSWWPITKVCII